ncbi:5-carboxymethyl-2-hydroxymuconate isomerase [Platysternon megacephalum]|uniref:Copper homeostasis protein cutC homolog n=1 Tax=Platysternon megacephalum TaxID=55544 RepID=A0A4D9DFN4_9SAUR|nr:5-carboxymethyl-2-hydroxymuconate isomerase [Platysternon megacephalum]
MGVLLEIVVRTESDARQAEQGGADRLMVVGAVDNGGMSPEPEVFARIRDAVTIGIRPMVRLRPGFSTDGGEATRLRGLMRSYSAVGADGMVMGFLNDNGDVDAHVCGALLAEGEWPWSFHRAVDSVFDADDAWPVLSTLPRLDGVITAGSARGVGHGLDELLRLAQSPAVARLIIAGGGLEAEHIPWLVRAGVRQFHVGRSARPRRDACAGVDADLVASWRRLLDSSWAHVHASTLP